MTSETPAHRLGRLVRARRKALKLTQADVQNLGGPSTATLRLIEGGKHTDFRGGTGSSLEAALQWAPGSIDDTLEGGDPTPLGSAIEFGPDPVLDQEVRFNSVAFVQEVTDIWEAWRDLGLRLAAGPDPDLSRQARRGLSLTATVLLNLLTLAGPAADSSALRADLTDVMFEVFKPEDNEGDTHAVPVDPSAQSDAQETGDENQEAGSPDEPEFTAAARTDRAAADLRKHVHADKNRSDKRA